MMMRVLVPSLVILVLAAGAAQAACPRGKASCVLHEQGVRLLTAGKLEEAAAKFQASLAAEATARAALGYAQAIEGQGKIALAYESLVQAKQLSDAELAARPRDVEALGRAERIKYKLGELRARVGMIQIKLPASVPPTRVVSVRRKGEGDLDEPLARSIVVVPDHQLLEVWLDDGTRIEVVAEVAAGMQGSVILPIAIPVSVQPGARALGVSAGAESPPSGAGAPPAFAIGVDLIGLVPNPRNASSGIGAAAVVERRLARWVGATARLALVTHPGATFEQITFSARELIATAGVRTRSLRSVHAFVEAGVLAYRRTGAAPPLDGQPPLEENLSLMSPVLALGGATRRGRMHVQLGAVWAMTASDAGVSLRLMASLGIDLVKR